MRRPTTPALIRLAALGLAGVACLAIDHSGQTQPRLLAASTPPPRNGRIIQYWPTGTIMRDAVFRDDVYEGEYRTYYQSGVPYELRHYVHGHELGLQQSWTDAGVLYLNYQVREGRRYGLVNATPCNTVGEQEVGATTGRDSARLLPSRGGAEGPVPGSAASASAGPERARNSVDEQTVVNGAAPLRIDRLVSAIEHAALPYYDGPTFQPQWTPVTHRVAAFHLRTQTGATISDGSLRGRPYVASFIYTQCAAVCPILVAQLARVQRTIGADRARVVSFSVTPDADTPDTLMQFARERGIDSRNWSLVTGSKRTIYTLARSSYFADDTRVGTSEDDETAFLHTEKLLLVDAEGHLRGVYNGTQSFAVDQLIQDLRQLAN